MSSESFGEVRAQLHGRDDRQDVWRALLGLWQKLDGEEHASMRAQMAHYVKERIERDSSWASCVRHAPHAWTNPHVQDAPREFDALYNALELSLAHVSQKELDAYLDGLDLDAEAITQLEVEVFAEDADKVMALLDRFPRIERLTCIDKDDLSFDLEAWRQMPTPRSLTHLTLQHTRLGQYGLEHLFALEWLPQITHLNLEWNKLANDQIAQLCEVGFERLETLELEYSDLSAEGVATLCDHPTMRHLRSLDLNLNGLYGECGEFLAQAVFAESLERLDIGFNWLSDAGIMQLCTHHFPSLKHLLVDSNGLSGVSIRRLAGAPFASQLEHIALSFAKEIEARDWLLLCDVLEQLTHIDLSFCALSQEVIEGMLARFGGRAIKCIQLAAVHERCEPGALIELVRAIDPVELRELSLSNNRLEDAHMLDLDTPLPALTELYLDDNALGARGLAHILSLIPSNRLKLLSAGGISWRASEEFVALRDEFARQRISQLELLIQEGSSESAVLEVLEACAPSLEGLVIREGALLSERFYRALGQLDMRHLRTLEVKGMARGHRASFEALTRGSLIAAPTLETLTWSKPEDDEGPGLKRPNGARPWLKLEA